MDHSTLYLDASGDQAWPKPIANSANEWHVLCGLVLYPEADLKAKNATIELLDEYSPFNIRSKFETKYHELHYNAIYNGQNIYSHLDFNSRVELINKVFDLIIRLKPIIMSISIKKDQHFHAYATPENPKLLAVRSVLSKYSMYLQRKQSTGSVVYDAEEYHKDLELRNMMHQFRETGGERRGMAYQPRKASKMDNILNTINLCPSEMSAGLQLTDFCAKAIWLHRERKMSTRFQQIECLYEYESSTGTMYGDTVFPDPSKWLK